MLTTDCNSEKIMLGTSSQLPSAFVDRSLHLTDHLSNCNLAKQIESGACFLNTSIGKQDSVADIGP